MAVRAKKAARGVEAAGVHRSNGVRRGVEAAGVRCAAQYYITQGNADAPLDFITDDIVECLAYLRRNLTGHGRLYRTADRVLLAYQKVPPRPTVPDLMTRR